MPRVNFDGVEEAEDYSPLPDGEYLCALTTIDAGQRTNMGDEMWDLKFTVLTGEYQGRSIFDRISFGHKALPRVKLLLSKMGIDPSGEIDVVPELIRGKKVHVRVETETYFSQKANEDREKNTVPYAGFRRVDEELEMEKAKVGGPHPPNAGGSLSQPDDDLPFARMEWL